MFFLCLFLGKVEGPSKMRHIVAKNQEMLNSYNKAVDELGVLRDNLVKKEVRVINPPPFTYPSNVSLWK